MLGKRPFPNSLALGDISNTYAWIALAIVACAGVSFFYTNHAELAAALNGWSAYTMLHPFSTLPQFIQGLDYPGGEASLLRSSLGQIYSLIGGISDQHDRALLASLVALEAAALTAAGAFLCRRLNPGLPVWTVVGGGLMLATGTMASADFARWFHPAYGYVYNYAYAAGFVAMAAAIGGRIVIAGIAIGLAATFHPIIASSVGVATGLVVLVRFKSYRFTSVVAGAAIAVGIAATWYLFAFRDAGIAISAAETEQFAAISRLMSFHWYPVSMGMFGHRSWETLLPTLAVLVVLASSLRLDNATVAHSDLQIFVAVLGLGAISLVGVWISVTSTDPLLLKLALHRASMIALLLAVALFAPRLLALATGGPLVVAIVAGTLLLLPYWRSNSIPLLGAAIFAVLSLYLPVNDGLGTRGRAVLFGSLALSAAVVAALVFNGHSSAVMFDVRATIGPASGVLFVGAFLVMLGARLLRSPALLAASFAIALYAWLPQMDLLRTAEQRERAEAMLETQFWARENTAPESVFMLDPAGPYGWRQYSHRPSFGTLREWLHSGWIYDTDPELMAEGLRRALTIGLDVTEYVEAADKDQGSAYAALRRDASNLFFGMSAAELSTLADQNGISYFVWDKAKGRELPTLPVVFQNEHYAVLAANDPS